MFLFEKTIKVPKGVTEEAPGKPVNWKRNLIIIWISQFLSLMGFSFGIPFVPYFLQELGVKTDHELSIWVALFAAAPALTMAIFAPIWGAVADRWGRRPMLLRAYFGAAIVLSLMGSVTHPIWLVALRLMQGALTGTVSAAQTLVSAHTPTHRSGFALGTLNSAVFSGSLTGAFLGGWTAEVFGYRTAFYFSGIVMLISAGLVFFGVREHLQKRSTETNRSKSIFAGLHPGKEQLKIALPILLLMSSVMFVRQFDSSFVPLLVQRIHGGLEGAAFISGMLFSVCGIAGMLSGIVLGWLSDRVSPGKIGKWSALIAALLILPQGFTTGIGLLFVERFGLFFASGGLEPVLQIWLCKMTPEKSRGLIFGWAASARSLGWFFAPLVSGAIASLFDLSYIFIVGSVCYVILFFLIIRTVKKLNKPETAPTDEEIESSAVVPDR